MFFFFPNSFFSHTFTFDFPHVFLFHNFVFSPYVHLILFLLKFCLEPVFIIVIFPFLRFFQVVLFFDFFFCSCLFLFCSFPLFTFPRHLFFLRFSIFFFVCCSIFPIFLIALAFLTKQGHTGIAEDPRTRGNTLSLIKGSVLTSR